LEKQTTISGIINEGSFLLNFSLPKNTRAQAYPIEVSVYEKDSSGKRINGGSTSLILIINQIPTSLDIIIESPEIQPGNILKFTPTLLDQSGEQMITSGIYTIKDPSDKIIDQIKGDTGSQQEFQIKNGSKAGLWKVFSVAYKNTAEKTFKILEQEEARIELRNTTLYIQNIGNIPYTKKVLVKIGEESYNIDPNLDLDEEKEFNLNKLGAPGGSHSIKISDGEKELTGDVTLTGKAISLISDTGKQQKTKSSPILWLIIVILAGVLGVIGYREGKKRGFWTFENKDVKTTKEFTLKGEELDFSTGKIKRAEYSPTIKGDAQPSIVVCLKLKNHAEIVRAKESIKETMDEINTFADANKAVLYENNEFMMYLFIPGVTKTVKNGRTALFLSREIHKIIEKHNRFFKQKIDYGVSLNLGEVIARAEKNSLKFTTTGDILTGSKKITEISTGEPLLSEKLRAKIMSEVKTERIEKHSIIAYRITEIINRDESKKFIGEFLKRNEDKKPRWQH
ncbi:MAG: hypothetical protein AABY22_07265, partial [Nanoarchaeota archaeon]